MASPRASASPAPCNPSPIAPATTMLFAEVVLGEMPPSVDDQSFLNIMDEQTFGDTACYVDGNIFDANTIDDELGSDVDGEFPKKKDSRGLNFTIAEDETLVRAWQTIFLDPISGDEQPGATYLQRIWDHFRHNNNSGIFRSQVSLTHRWQTIQVCCTKWADSLAQVYCVNPSGASARDKVMIFSEIALFWLFTIHLFILEFFSCTGKLAQPLYKGKPKKKGGKAGKAFAL
ncbi:hypothetical protein BAE44_0026341 [Dichanthelium oligosanthes]|uniref:No apical meristem-associated C-terminal domain-containing protein n=1 Tax=Dichanthelium oligosanthes TaxID=888268 RepID=A0A1E5UIE7_9POAL|nr:hypothetical protein BAE44_0026341 [Dichanthelium oligosanthes]